jgi:hypothetical protein
MSDPIARITVDGETYYVPLSVAEDYRRRFDDQSERFSDVFERAEVEVEAIRQTPEAIASLAEHFDDIERDGIKEQKRWQR